MKHLVIISHTEHYKARNGKIFGLGSTVAEINHLLNIFDFITHVGMLHDIPVPPNTLPYKSNKVTFIAIPAMGGPGMRNKLSIIIKAPKVIKVVKESLENADYFQFRAPTGIGVFIIPYLILFCKNKNGWFKYAGNWKQQNAPLAYSFQRWLLKKQSKKVTINGFWDNQPSQCLSFENPCLDSDEIQNGQMIIKHKKFSVPLNLCFIGRVEPEKGVDLIIDTLSRFSKKNALKIKSVHFVGDGKNIELYRKKTKELPIEMIFHGMLTRKKVHELYETSHAILLPSKSEGFPKVIAEAINYGCLPIVSNVSSIGHYIIDGGNGFLLNELTVNELTKQLLRLTLLSEEEFKLIASIPQSFMERFSYNYYNNRLLTDIFMKK